MVLSSVLVGVVFATMALVVSLLSDAYLRLLCGSDRGFLPFMAPFVAGMSIQILAVAIALCYRVVADVYSLGEPWIFCGLTVVFAYAVMDVISLAKTVIAHAVTRAEYTALTEEQEKRS